MKSLKSSVVLCFSATACMHADYKGLPKTDNFAVSSSTAEAGRVSVDIPALNQWQDIAAHFQPNYNLSGQSALTLVNRAASYENGSYIQSVGGGLSVSAGGAVLTKGQSTTTTTTTDANGQNSSTDTSSTSRDSKQSTPDTPSSLTLPTSSVTGNQFSSQSPNLAPIVNYQSADALFRYAAVLDQGFGNMAPCGYVPVLVTLRLTVSANKKNQPYDTIVDVSIFPKKPADAAPSSSLSSSMERESQTPLGLAGRSKTASGQPSEVNNGGGGVASDEVVACGRRIHNDDVSIVSFSSDSLENGQNDVLAQQTKAIALAAALRAGMVSASANFQSLASAIDHNLFLRPNSLVSVARAGDNVLHIRLGANRFGVNDYEMLSLDHQISVVLMIPNQDFGNNNPNITPYSIAAVASYHFEDVRGRQPGVVRPLHDADSAWLNERAQYLHDVARTEMADFAATASIPALTTCAEQLGSCGSLAQISEQLANMHPAEFNRTIFGGAILSDEQVALSNDLRGRLARYAFRPGVTSASRQLPISVRVCPLNDLTFPIVDDGTNATVSVTGADGYQGAHLNAKLTVWKIGPKGTRLSPTSVSTGYDATGPDIGDIKFTSVTGRFVASDTLGGEIYFWGRDLLQCPGGQPGAYPLSFVKPAKANAARTKKQNGPVKANGVSNLPAQINAINGAGNFAFSLKLADAKATTVDVSTDDAAQLVDVAGTTAAGGKVTLSQDGDFSVNVKNITAGKAFTLTFSFKSSGKLLSQVPVKMSVVRGS